MIQAFYTAASGMLAQQQNIDIVSNNIANINTPGYRPKRAEFKELLYTARQSQASSEMLPIGHGTFISGVSAEPLPEELNPYGLSISGNAYFVVQDGSGAKYYTKNGNFKLLNQGGRYYLATQKDEFVLDSNGNKIELPNNPDMFVVADGVIYPQGNNGEQGITPALVQFDNAAGLKQVDRYNYIETSQSGAPVISQGARIKAGYTEEHGLTSLSDQITRLLQTQMAFRLNSKALQVTDEMEGMANHLRY